MSDRERLARVREEFEAACRTEPQTTFTDSDRLGSAREGDHR